jgi:hypothetical protein
VKDVGPSIEQEAKRRESLKNAEEFVIDKGGKQFELEQDGVVV